MRTRGELRPLQVETLRFVQGATDRAYERGLRLLRIGKLPVRLSRQEALGNYIDREVRMELKERLNLMRIDWAGAGPVRVNRRELIGAASESTFRRPDARVGNVAYDVTLTPKTLKTPQVQGFFRANFMPDYVIIVRPTQLGNANSYAIARPEGKQ